MSFTQLHIHTNFSLLDGISSSMDYAKLAKEKGHPALAITDHGKMSGFLKHQEACIHYGIKPIFGVEAYVEFDLVRTDEKTGKRTRNKNMHLIILAKNEVGYKNLLKLNYISMAEEDHYYYRNHILIDEVFENKEGLIIGSGCANSPFNTLFREGKEKEAEELYARFVKEFGDDFYTELHISELYGEDYDLDQKKINDFELRMARKFNRLVVLAGDVHYNEKGKDKIQTIGIAIRNKDKIDNLTFEIESKNLYYHDVNDYKKFNKDWEYGYTDEQIEEWCSNTLRIADKCSYLIPERTRMCIPKITEDDDESLIVKSKEGLARLFNKEKFEDCPEEYKERLHKELRIIIRKGFSSYMLLLDDVFQMIHSEGHLCGVGRGSACGSLILYVLKITTLDPIKYGLLFERFLSESRAVDATYDFFL